MKILDYVTVENLMPKEFCEDFIQLTHNQEWEKHHWTYTDERFNELSLKTKELVIQQSTVENITRIEGIDEKTAKELIDRAAEVLKKDAEEISKKIKEFGVAEDLINLKGLTQGMLVTLGEQKILTLKDFAELASDELIGDYDIIKGEKVKIKGYLEDFALTKKEADDLIMSARNIVY